jgi:hypothetical protein
MQRYCRLGPFPINNLAGHRLGDGVYRPSSAASAAYNLAWMRSAKVWKSETPCSS